MIGRDRKPTVQALKLGAAAQTLPLVSSYGLNMLATPYILAELGLHNFGIWSVTAGIVQYLALGDLGVARAANRYVALYHARGDKASEGSVVAVCAIALAGLSIVLYAVPAFFSGLLDYVLRVGDVELVSSLLYASITALAFALVVRTLTSISIGRGRQVPANIGLSAFGIAQIIGGIIALVQEPSLLNFAWGTTAGAAIGFVVVVVIIFIDEGPTTVGRPSWRLAREVLLYGSKGQILGAADIVWYQSGKVIAGILIGPSAAGAYELGIRLIKGAQAFGAAASVALTTHLTRQFAVSGQSAIKATYAALTQRNAAVAIFPPLLLGATALTLVPLWLGNQQHTVSLVVVAFSLGVAANVSTGVCTATFMAVGRAGIVGVAALTSALIGVILALLLGRAWGINAIVWSFALWLLVSTFLQMMYLHRRIDINVSVFFRSTAGPFAVGAVASIPPAVIGLLASPTDRASALVPFVVSSAVFIAIFAGLGWTRGYLPRPDRWT